MSISDSPRWTAASTAASVCSIAAARSRHASSCARGAITIPSSSASTRSPGVTRTPPKRIAPPTRGATSERPAIGTVPRAHSGSAAGSPVRSRTQPSTTIPPSPRRAASLASSSPSAASGIPAACTTSTSPASAWSIAHSTDRNSPSATTV